MTLLNTNVASDSDGLPTFDADCSFEVCRSQPAAASRSNEINVAAAGMLSRLPIELLHYLLSVFIPGPADQLPLGRSCKWLLLVLQSTRPWQDTWPVLSDPASPLAYLASPVFDQPFQIPSAAFNPRKHAICLTLHKIDPGFPWSVYDYGFSFRVGPLLLRPFSTPAMQPVRPVHHQEQPFLPLFISQSHFDSSFPLLHEAVRNNLIHTQHEGFLSIPETMITEFFPRLVSNLATKLVLAEVAPTTQDVEVFVQIHLAWRAVVQRYGKQAQAWISSKVQLLLGSLALQDYFVNLSVLISLLHVCDTKQWTWTKLARGVVDENTIRMFQFILECKQCTMEANESGLPLHVWSMQVGNSMTQMKVERSECVPWPVLGFHLRFLRAIQSPSSPDPFCQGGQLSCQLQLEPGPLAQQLHAVLSKHIRAHPSADSWSTLLSRLGASPLDKDTLTSWLSWCHKQAEFRPRDDDKGCELCSCRDYCRCCAYVSEGSSRSNMERYDAMPLTCVTFSREPVDPNSIFYCLPLPPPPQFAFVALTRRGALVGVHSPHHNMCNLPASTLSRDCVPIPTHEGHTSIHLGCLPTYVAYVCVLVSDLAVISSIRATPTPYPMLDNSIYCNGYWAHESAPRSRDRQLATAQWRLAHVCVRDRSTGSDQQLWQVVSASTMKWLGVNTEFDRYNWMISNYDGSSMELCIKVAQEWACRWEFEGRAKYGK